VVTWRAATFVGCAVAAAAASIACNALIGLRQPAEELVEGGDDEAGGGDEAAADGPRLPCAEGETTCGERCVVLATDSTNCGACGRECGSSCISGLCTPRAAVTAFSVHGISGNVVIGDFEVRQFALTSPPVLLYTSTTTADSVAVAGPVVFIAAPPGDEIVAVPTSLQDAAPSVVAVDAGSLSLAASSGFLYWASSDPSATAVMHAPIGDAGAAVPIAPLQPTDRACALSAARYGVYWASARGTFFATATGHLVIPVTVTANDPALAAVDSPTGIVVSSSATGDLLFVDAPTFSNPRILVAGAHATAVATDGTYVYYASNTINRVPLIGGFPQILVATTITTEARCNVPRIAVDGQHVYWIDRTNTLLYVPK
jgi:hypothetical protein